MQRMKLDQDIKPLSEFRANTTACIQQVHNTKRPIVITQHGKSSAVLLDVQEYEKLLEQLELFKDVRRAEKQLESGQGIAHESVKKQIMGRLKQ